LNRTPVGVCLSGRTNVCYQSIQSLTTPRRGPSATATYGNGDVNGKDDKRRSLARGDGLPEPLLLEDPMEALPPTAQRILAAARRLLVAGGFEALKLSAIAAEAGESKASIGYHFGNKDGLVAALVDSLAHDANRGLIAQTANLPARDERMRALIDGETRIAADAESFQAFFEALPHALRDPGLRPRVAALYEGYRETVLRCLDPGDAAARETLRPFAMLMIAIVDGLAIQHGLDPDGTDVAAATELWDRLARPFLEDVRETRRAEGA
jgi:AcrR family transcriptional regulator